MASKQYPSSPITEAMCEIRYTPAAAWDLTIPGLFYERIKEDFPKRVQDKGVETTISLVGGGVQTVPVERLRFAKDDDSAFIQVADNALIVSLAAPYPGWESFLSMITQASATYQDVAHPSLTVHAGLRYINRITVPSELFNLSDYFRFYPYANFSLDSGSTSPTEPASFFIGMQIPRHDTRDVLQIQFAPLVPPSPDQVSFYLDLDYRLMVPNHIEIAQLREWLEEAHSTIEAAFEGCITNKLREAFEKEDPHA